jgi:hypothetical protein
MSTDDTGMEVDVAEDERNVDYTRIPWFTIVDPDTGVEMERTIPQVFPIPGSMRTFYERECYETMYNELRLRMKLNTPLKERINPVMCAVVYGTPGIGKSIFEFYFFNRYIAEHPDHVVALSSWKNFQPQEIFIYNLPKARGTFVFVDKFPLVVDLHLCDGAPTSTFQSPTVCFTSPNFKFFDKHIRKDTRAKKFVMPNWTVDSLLEANLELHLGIPDDEIIERVKDFGPIARIVLQPDTEDFEIQKAAVLDGLNKINSWKQVAPYFEVSLEMYQSSADVVHRLFKIEPDDNPRKCRIEFASDHLAEQIRVRLGGISALDSKQLFDWLGSSGLASAFRGFLYEEYCHSCFKKGLSLSRRRIDEEKICDNIVVLQSDVPRFARLSDISLQTLGYLVPISRFLQSIDSVLHQEYVDNAGRRLVLCMIFQMTISESGHPMDADGIVKYMEAVGIYEDVEKNPQMYSINFVIPSSIDSSYKSPQPIEGVRVRDVSSFPDNVKDLKGFGGYGFRTTSLQRIEDMGISQVSDLKTKFKANEDIFEFEKLRLRRLFVGMDAIPRNLNFLLKIPQYVIHLDVQ